MKRRVPTRSQPSTVGTPLQTSTGTSFKEKSIGSCPTLTTSSTASSSPVTLDGGSHRPRSGLSSNNIGANFLSNHNTTTTTTSSSGNARRGRHNPGGGEIPVVPTYPRPHTSGSYGSRRSVPTAPQHPISPTHPRASTADAPPPNVTSAAPTPVPPPAAAAPPAPRSRPATNSMAYLVPPPREEDEGKLVVVLDLDETLIFSRGNRVFERQGVSKLLQTLKGRCEVIVWTAGTRDYALDVIRIIDPYFSIQHCIYRHPMWWNGEIGCTKDLRMLGRPMDRVVLIDNTPEVFRANPENGILVSDFLGREAMGGRSDRTLGVLADIFEYVLSHLPEPKTSDVFASHRLHKRTFRLDGKRRVEIFAVVGDRHESIRL